MKYVTVIRNPGAFKAYEFKSNVPDMRYVRPVVVRFVPKRTVPLPEKYKTAVLLMLFTVTVCVPFPAKPKVPVRGILLGTDMLE